MKLDYDYIKKILLTMEDYENHQIDSYILMQMLGIRNENNQIDDALLDKFIGHLKLLADNQFIVSSSSTLGFRTGMDGSTIMANALYRITSRGYEFLDVLKNDTILKKVSKFALSNAWDIGKQLLMDFTSRKMIG